MRYAARMFSAEIHGLIVRTVRSLKRSFLKSFPVSCPETSSQRGERSGPASL